MHDWENFQTMLFFPHFWISHFLFFFFFFFFFILFFCCSNSSFGFFFFVHPKRWCSVPSLSSVIYSHSTKSWKLVSFATHSICKNIYHLISSKKRLIHFFFFHFFCFFLFDFPQSTCLASNPIFLLSNRIVLPLLLPPHVYKNRP